jgi:hypothetical protein
VTQRLYLIVVLALASVAAAQDSARQFAGRWDLTVTRNDAVFPSWMEVTETDGKVEVRVQEREGSVHPVGAEMAEHGRLIVIAAPAAAAKPASGNKAASPARPARIWEFTSEGGALNGTIKVGGNVQAQIRGMRAPALKRGAPAAWSQPVSLFNGKDLTGWTTMNHTISGPRERSTTSSFTSNTIWRQARTAASTCAAATSARCPLHQSALKGTTGTPSTAWCP